MGFPMDAEPGVGIRLVFADLRADLLMEDLRAAARQAPQPGFLHIRDQVLRRPLGELAKPIPLHSRPCFQMQVGIRIVNDLDDVAIPFIRHLVMQAADDVQLGAASLMGLAGPLDDLLVAHQIALRGSSDRPERHRIYSDRRRRSWG